MNRRLSWTWSALLCALLILGACSDDDDGSSHPGHEDAGQADAAQNDAENEADTGSDTAEPDATGEPDGGEDTNVPDDTSDDASESDGGPDDAETDTSEPDVTVEDVGDDTTVEPDMPEVDAGEVSVPLAGFGAITGDSCGILDDELTSPEPFFFRNALDFGSDPYDDVDYDQLTVGGQEIIDDGNAGGSSIHSEVFTFEMLHRCELAELLKTENEVVYDTQGSITDMLVSIDGMKVGVSVTRAFSFPPGSELTADRARSLLDDKLEGVVESSANVSEADRWVKQILYVIAYNAQHADAVESAFAEVDAAVKADTIVIVTVSDGDDDFLY